MDIIGALHVVIVWMNRQVKEVVCVDMMVMKFLFGKLYLTQKRHFTVINTDENIIAAFFNNVFSPERTRGLFIV